MREKGKRQGGRAQAPPGGTCPLFLDRFEVEGFAEMGLSDTKADILDDRLSIVWGREWSRRRFSAFQPGGGG